jgi:oxygen-independent coproporphyrinogen-3 oxidase
MKTGRLEPAYFSNKFGIDIVERWRDQWNAYADEGWVHRLDAGPEGPKPIQLTMDGLLRVDALLPAFFEPEFQGVRYT